MIRYKSDKQVKSHLEHMHGKATLTEEARESPAFERAEERIGHFHLGKKRRQAISKYKISHHLGKKV